MYRISLDVNRYIVHVKRLVDAMDMITYSVCLETANYEYLRDPVIQALFDIEPRPQNPRG